MEVSHKEAAISFLKMIVARKIKEAYAAYVDARFKHHNQYFEGTTAALMEGMITAHQENPDTSIEVKFALEDGEKVAVYSHVKHNPDDPGFAVVHIFRFESGKIVEMWDIGAEVLEDSPNVNGVF